MSAVLNLRVVLVSTNVVFNKSGKPRLVKNLGDYVVGLLGARVAAIEEDPVFNGLIL
jgi:hypothetical protein